MFPFAIPEGETAGSGRTLWFWVNHWESETGRGEEGEEEGKEEGGRGRREKKKWRSTFPR